MSTEPKLPLKSTNNNKIPKQPKKQKPKNKPIVQEIIDLEADNDDRRPNSSENFISDIAKKCNSFFSWISNTSSSQLAEHLWKQSMINEAAQRFPELNNNELIRLVDRDWAYMSEEDRARIVEEYSKCPREEQLKHFARSYVISQSLIGNQIKERS